MIARVCCEIVRKWLHQNVPVLYGSISVVVSGGGKDGKAQKNVACKLCDLKLTDGSETTNLANHLKKKHPEQYKHCTSDSETSSKQTLLKTMLQKCTLEKSAAITDKIVGFIAKDLRPLSIVDGVGFQEIVSCLEPKYKIPSRTHITSMCHKKF